MPHIVVDEKQAQVISGTAASIEIRDQQGNHLGYVAHGFTDEDIAIAKQRMASREPGLTTREVLEHLNSLDAQ